VVEEALRVAEIAVRRGLGGAFMAKTELKTEKTLDSLIIQDLRENRGQFLQDNWGCVQEMDISWRV